MLKTLYLHGLNSFLNDEKRAILEKFTIVTAPTIDYATKPQTYYDLLEKAKKENFDVIIGTSMGGFVGYYLSLELGLPALLYNPALPYRSVAMATPDIITQRTTYLKVILGGQDDIIDPKENMALLLAQEKGDIDILWRNTLGHRIPSDVFEEEVGAFFEKNLKTTRP